MSEIATMPVFEIAFTVIGKPQPGGSKRGFPVHRKNGTTGVALSDANPKAKNWQHAVADAARAAYDGPLLNGALSVTMTFYVPRPKGHFGKRGLNSNGLRAIAPTTRPDVLKLARAVEDALTGVLWRDDAQIVREVLEKSWGEPARVYITVADHSMEVCDA